MARGRRSDHTRDELRDLILVEGSRLLAETGFHGFSARELARRIDYSVHTVLGVLGGGDGLMTAINTRTFGVWAEKLQADLAKGGTDRLAVLVRAYFGFAIRNPGRWRAIYDHKIHEGVTLPVDQAEARALLTGIVVEEVAAVLPLEEATAIAHLTTSLIATVHGHCDMAESGNMKLMSVEDPAAMALDRVRDAITVRKLAQAGLRIDALT